MKYFFLIFVPVAMPDPTENSPKSCLAFSAAERADANPTQDALTQIPAVRQSTIITSAIWTYDRRAVTDAEKYFERGKDATRLYVARWDEVKHGGNPKAGRTAISQTGEIAGKRSLTMPAQQVMNTGMAANIVAKEVGLGSQTLAIERSAENTPAQRAKIKLGPRSREKLCRWKCVRKTARICGICLQCCDERDRQIASGAPYVPPSERPGHRFYERKTLSESKKAALTKARAIQADPQGEEDPAAAVLQHPAQLRDLSLLYRSEVRLHLKPDRRQHQDAGNRLRQVHQRGRRQPRFRRESDPKKCNLSATSL